MYYSELIDGVSYISKEITHSEGFILFCFVWSVGWFL
jgi:hypothetical protein